MKGKVTKILKGKNFGFILGEDNKDYFFHRDDFSGHWHDMVNDLRKGMTIYVTFEKAESNTGLRASDVRRVRFPNES